MRFAFRLSHLLWVTTFVAIVTAFLLIRSMNAKISSSIDLVPIDNGVQLFKLNNCSFLAKVGKDDQLRIRTSISPKNDTPGTVLDDLVLSEGVHVIYVVADSKTGQFGVGLDGTVQTHIVRPNFGGTAVESVGFSNRAQAELLWSGYSQNLDQYFFIKCYVCKPGDALYQ